MNKGLGIHVVEPLKKDLLKAVKENYSFIAFSTDTIILDRALSSAFEIYIEVEYTGKKIMPNFLKKKQF